MFIADVLISALTWKQPGCPSVGEWMKCGTTTQLNIIQQ